LQKAGKELMLANHKSQNILRNGCVVLVWIVVVTLLLSGCTAPTPKVYKVGILSGTDDFLPIGDGFKAGMAKLGYVEGKNITYEVQSANADVPALDRMAKKFVDEKVDMIVTIATEASLAAKQAAQVIR
jgi:putative tryptophan/tyrosine transport system substrate-binding protein